MANVEKVNHTAALFFVLSLFGLLRPRRVLNRDPVVSVRFVITEAPTVLSPCLQILFAHPATRPLLREGLPGSAGLRRLTVVETSLHGSVEHIAFACMSSPQVALVSERRFPLSAERVHWEEVRCGFAVNKEYSMDTVVTCTHAPRTQMFFFSLSSVH